MTPDPKKKGIYNGNCNRTACQKPGARHVSLFVRNAFYCGECASLINKANERDCIAMYGVRKGVIAAGSLLDGTVVATTPNHAGFTLYVWSEKEKWINEKHSETKVDVGTIV
jgi:hypothetical protein